MEFNQGATVFTTDAKEVGHIDRVVIDPKTNDITHVVVHKGFFVSEDKVVPVGLLNAGQKDQVMLQLDSEQLEQQPNFEETDYLPLNDERQTARTGAIGLAPPALYWYPTYGGTPLLGYPISPFVVEIRKNTPAGTIAVKPGAKVITRDGKNVGDVIQLLTGSDEERVTHCLISKGLLMKEKKLIPVGWIEYWGEDELRLAVESATVDRLPVFEHA